MDLRLKILFFWWVFWTPITLCHAQNYDTTISSDSLKSLLKQSSIFLETYNDSLVMVGFNNLDFALEEGEKRNDKLLQGIANRVKAEFYFLNYNFKKAYQCLGKSVDLLTEVDNKRELGLTYEVYSVLYTYQDKEKKRDSVMLKAKHLLDKFGKEVDKIDANYNIAFVKVKEKKYKDALPYIYESLKAVKKSNKKINRKKFLRLMLANCFIELDQADKAKTILDSVDDTFYYDKLNYFEKLYKIKALYYEKIGDYKKAVEYNNLYKKHFDRYSRIRKEFIGKAIVVNYEQRYDKQELKRIASENEKNKIKLLYNNYIIVSSLILILSLIIFSFIQFSHSEKNKKLNSLLQIKNKELTENNKLVKNAVKIKSLFLDTINHEIRTPLSTIKGVVHLLKSTRLTKKQNSHVDILYFSTDHLIRLFENIVEHSQIDKDDLTLKTESFNLQKLIENVSNSLSVVYGKCRNGIKMDIDPDIPKYLVGDTFKISQIFINLIGEGLRKSSSGTIHVLVKQLERKIGVSKLFFEIKGEENDEKLNGMNSIYDGFNNSGSGIKSMNASKGLELTIVNKILSIYNSRINYKSLLGKESSFSFTIDFKISKAKHFSNSKTSHLSFKQNENTTVLVVNDNETGALATCDILKDYGFNCKVVNSKSEAISLLKTINIAVIVIDISMKNNKSFEIVKALKLVSLNTVIIGVSSKAEHVDLERYRSYGVETVLYKPIIPELLFQTIVSFLEEKKA